MSQIQEIKITNCDPGPLGIFGLAMVTFIAASQKIGITSGTSFLVPWAIFLGASAQLIGCLQEFKRVNIFAATTFGAFALFWFAMGMAWLIQAGVFGEAMAAAIDPKQLGFAFLGYFIFAIFLTIPCLEINKCFFLILLFVDLLLLGLTLYAFGIAPSFSSKLAAWAELLTALMGFYTAGAILLNNFFGRVMLPLGAPFGIIKKG